MASEDLWEFVWFVYELRGFSVVEENQLVVVFSEENWSQAEVLLLGSGNVLFLWMYLTFSGSFQQFHIS